jgi:hypothetical protein
MEKHSDWFVCKKGSETMTEFNEIETIMHLMETFKPFFEAKTK